MYQLRFFIAVALLVISTPHAIAQSVNAFYEANGVFDESRAGLASNNIWFGATPLLQFNTRSNPQFDIHAAGQVVYTISNAGKIKWPVRANLSTITSNINLDEVDEDAAKAKALELASSSEGATVGVYPFLSLLDNTGVFSITLHGTGAWKINAFKKDEQEDPKFLNQWRISVGLDFGFGDIGGGEKHRTILSISPVVTFVDKTEYEVVFGNRKTRIFGLEGIVILPIADQIGFAVNYILGDEAAQALRIGLILAAETQ